MAGVFKLQDGLGTKTSAQVTKRGQVVVGATSFSEASSISLTVDDVPVNAFAPKSGFNFIITGILLYGNKGIGAGDATVSIYESTVGPTSATQSKLILTTELPKYKTRDLIGLNLEVTEGSWVNAVTDDNTVFVTILGYYICACP